jgi:hypothetical protein
MLAGTGAVIISGCSGSPSTQGNDDVPFDREPSSFIPEANVYGSGWERPGEIESEDEQSASAEFINMDISHQVVDGVEIFNSVSNAKDVYTDKYDSASEGASEADEVTVGKTDIAVESYYYKIDTITVTFRDANVIGTTFFANFSGNSVGGSTSKAEQYAATYHETWREPGN